MAKLNWSDEKVDNPLGSRLYAEMPLMAAREGHCYQDVLAITVALLSMRRRRREAIASTS
jgi:hypothetical protein